MPATDKEQQVNAALDPLFIDDIASLLKTVDEIDDTPAGFYLYGDIEVRHRDGWRAGTIKSYEDSWVFVPEGAEL